MPFQYPKNSDNRDIFKEDASFEKIVDFYYFDAELRVFLLYWLSELECLMRTNIAYIHAKEFGAFGYLNPNSFKEIKLKKRGNHATLYEEVSQKIIVEINRTNEDFIKYFKNHYNCKYPPIWVLVEILSFGTLSKIFKIIRPEQKKEILENLNLVIDAHIFEKWLENLTIIRNMAAHCSRIWNRRFIKPFKYPKHEDFLNSTIDNKTIFSAISVIVKILKKPKIKTQFKDLLVRYPEIHFEAMGIPNNWEELEPWRSL